MAQISVNDLTFYYEGSYDNIFEHVSFAVDTDWKLGFIGRNGKGKTTFLNLLLGRYEYKGSITASTVFDYFPYQIKEETLRLPAIDFAGELKAGLEQWRMLRELGKLKLDAEVLYRPFCTLSFGEQTKLLLAVLFSGENDFLLIDEPTNHLDMEARETVKEYLRGKKGFILVSHDRDFLDACVDHVLVFGRQTIEVQAGNFSSWWENKKRQDLHAQMENEKHRKEIVKLKAAARQTRQWADKNERTKIGFDPVKEPDRCKGTRAFIGAKTKKMQSRVGQMERRLDREIEEKEGLLRDIEETAALKLTPLSHHKRTLVAADKFGLMYAGGKGPLFEDLSFEIEQGSRMFLNGANGCGKSSLIKAILRRTSQENEETKECAVMESGGLRTASGLVVSYISQDTSFLQGSIKKFCKARNLKESLFLGILRRLDMDRVQFGKDMREYSEGQKKKVLIAASLLTPAHLYIWDEPLNYIDVFSRMQIEELILAYRPTMLAVEHDVRFRENIATEVVDIN